MSAREIYIAGGCFWGTEKYFDSISGVTSVEVGYANGKNDKATYEEVCTGNTGHVEAVKIKYDSEKITLKFLLDMFYKIIDPTSLNKQGGDIGTQYRTGIYYVDEDDINIINTSIENLQKNYDKPILIEVLPLYNYCTAEEYHQKYLDKNSGGYCHISSNKFLEAEQAVDTSI